MNLMRLNIISSETRGLQIDLQKCDKHMTCIIFISSFIDLQRGRCEMTHMENN